MLILPKACGKIPGFIYLALGDPLQKRNYYRAGWLKFGDDADMPTVMAELTEKKVVTLGTRSGMTAHFCSRSKASSCMLHTIPNLSRVGYATRLRLRVSQTE